MRKDPKHLALVRQIPCVVCSNEDLGDSPAEPHHIKLAGHSGVGYKADDDETIALCTHHHHGTKEGNEKGQIGYHQGHKAFEDRYGTQLELVEQTRFEVEHVSYLTNIGLIARHSRRLIL